MLEFVVALVVLFVVVGFATYLGALMALRDFFGASNWDEATD